MFLHSAWIFHSEPRVAPINSTEPPVTSICSALLASTQGLTGACRRAAAPPLTAKTAIFHRAVSGVTGSLSQAPHTSFLFLLRASGWTYHKAQAEQTWRLCYGATPKGYQLQMILWHLLQMDACCQSWPIVKVCVGVGWDGMVLAPRQECGSLGNLQAGLATNKLFNTGLLNVTQIASEVTDKCRYSLLRIFSPEQVDAELRELCLISSIVPECKLNVVLGEIQYFIRCTFMEDKQYFPYSMSHSGASLPLCLFLSLVPSPSVYFKQSWIIPVYHSAVTKLGMGVLPQSLSARLRRQLLALKIFPIMQTDKGMLFKSPQPICWSLFIYKGLQAASPVKTILDTYVRSLASSPLCFPPSCLLNKVSLRLPQTITFHSA